MARRKSELRRKIEEQDRRNKETVYPVVKRTVGDYDDRQTYRWIALEPMTRQQYKWRLQDSRDPGYYDPEYREDLEVFESELERDEFLANQKRNPRRKNPMATGTLLAFGIGYFLSKK